MAEIRVGDQTFDSQNLDTFEAFRKKTKMATHEATKWMSDNKVALLTVLVKHHKVAFLEFWCLCCDVSAADIVIEAINQNDLHTFEKFINRVLSEQVRNDLIEEAKKKPSLKDAAMRSQMVALRKRQSCNEPSPGLSSQGSTEQPPSPPSRVD